MENRDEKKREMRIGEVYLMRFEGIGSEQNGVRPGVVFQNNIGNAHSPNIVALPLTSAVKKVGQPTHVLVRACDSGLLKDSVVLCENPECMSKERVMGYLTTLPDAYMRKVAEASVLASCAIAYLDLEMLVAVWKKAAAMAAKAA